MRHLFFILVILIMGLLTACDPIMIPTITPTHALTGPTLAPTDPAIPAPPSEVPGNFIDPAGSSNPTAAALPNNLDLPPLSITSESSLRSVQIALAAITITGELYANVPIRAPGILMIGEEQAIWGDFPEQLEESGYVVLVVNLPSTAAENDLRQLLGSFIDLAQGDASRLDPGRIAVVAEQTMADLALQTCSTDLICDALVLLSPTNRESASTAIGRYGTRPLLVAASQEYPLFFDLGQTIVASAQGEALFQPLNNAGSGTEILQNRPDMNGFITSWLNRQLR